MRRALAALAILCAPLAAAQVSERVVRELLALPQPTEHEWQYLVGHLKARGETDLAILVLDANASDTSGRLYQWHRSKKDVDGMLHEIRVSYFRPRPLPDIVEDAIMLGGHDRALQAYDYVRQHGLPMDRNYFYSIASEHRPVSPEFAMYFLLANEGREEEANRFLPLISKTEIVRYRGPLLSILYFGKPPIVAEMHRIHPDLVSPEQLLHTAYVHKDESLKDLAVHDLLFEGGSFVGMQGGAMGLVIDLARQGRTHTARRIAVRRWDPAGRLNDPFAGPLRQPLLGVLCDLGLQQQLEEYAHALITTARDVASQRRRPVLSVRESHVSFLNEAVQILLVLGRNSEADAVLDEVRAAQKEMGGAPTDLVSESVRHLIYSGRYEEAIERALGSGTDPTQFFVVGEVLQMMDVRGESDAARSLLRALAAKLDTESSAALGLTRFFGLHTMISHMRRLGLHDEAKQMIKAVNANRDLSESAWHTFYDSAFYAAVGDWRSAKLSMRLTVAQDPFRPGFGFGGGQFHTWKQVAGLDASALAKVGADEYVRSALKDRIKDGVFTEQYPRGWAEGFVTALRHVQEDRTMTEAVLGELTRFFAALRPGWRANVDYFTLTSAIQGRVSMPGVETPPLRPSLQERVLDIILETRPKPGVH